MTGDATASAYQAVLQSVALSTDAAGVRTIEFAVTDAAGQDSVLPGVTLLTVTPALNGAPTIVATPVGVGSTGQSTTVSPIIVIVNEPGELLSGATVTITVPDGSDELTFTGSGGITGSYLNGVLTLTGDASAAAYQAVLQSVSLSTDAAGVRTIQFSVTDAAGQESVLPGVTLLTVTPVLNGAPTIVTTPVGVGSTGQSTVVSPIIVIVNEPSELLSGATVTITVPDGSDELTFVGSGGITGSYANGVLTLTGDATASAYQAVLQSVALSTDAAGVRTIQFAVTDAAGQDSVLPGVTLLTVTPTLNGAPTIVTTPVGVGSTGQSTTVSPVIVIVNEPSELLSGATVTITVPDGSDELTFTGSGGITGSYVNGVLTLTGDASAAAYQAVLQSVALSTDAAGVRTIQFSVTDAAGQVSALPGVTLFTVTPALNGAPTIVATPVGVGSTGQSTTVSPVIVIVNEPGELLSGATVTITSPDGSDELTFVGSGGITGSYANGVLTLTGDATASAYQAVLQSVALSTDAAGVRTIEFAVTDAAGQDSVLPGVTLLTVTPALNGAPTIVATPVGVGSTGQSTVVSPIIVIVNEPGELLSGATVTITSPDGSDELTFVESGGITGSYSGGVLTLTGDASAAAYQTVLQSVSLSTDVAGVRTIQFAVTDAAGQVSALPGVTLFTVTPALNGAPTIVATPVGVGSTGQSTTVSPVIVIVNEPGELLSGATVTITVPDGSDELTFVESGGITGSYANGVLTLTGDATASAYQAVLQSVALSTDAAGVRTIQFAVTDAAGQESVLPGVTLLTVTPALNGAPTIVTTPVGVGSTGQSTVVSPIIVIVNEPSELLSGATVTITSPDGSDELTFTGSGGITGSYVNGVLTLTGDASAAAYQAVLQSVSLSTDAAGVRTIEFAVTDAAGQDSVLPGVTLLTVTPALNGAPTIVATPVGVGSTGQSTVVSPIIVIVNEPGELLSGATVTITSPDGSDELTFVGSGGITGSYSGGVLTLTGDASAAAYQTVLQSVSLSADVAGVRTIEFAVTDAAGQESALPGVTLLTVTPVLNGAPTIVTTPVGVGSTGQSTVVSPIVVIVNEPGELLSGATVTITSPDGSDELTFTESGGITGSYVNGVLTLTGDASAAAYQTVLQSVALSTDVAGVRTIQFAVTDAAGQESVLPGVTLLAVTPVLNGAPTIVTTPVGVGSTGQSTTVSPLIVIVNEPSELLSGAGVLTLTGDATASAYQAVLQSVALSTDAAGVRTIEFAVTDAAGQESVLPGVTLLTVTPALNGAPTIVTTPVGVGSTGQSTVVSPLIVIVNEPSELLSGATVTITVPDSSDELTFVGSGGITGTYSGGVLTLTGDASAAAYQAVLQSVSLSTDAAGVRTIQFSVTDAAGQASALPGVTLYTVTPALNGAPTIVATPVGVGSTGQSNVVSPIIVIVNEPGELLSGATVTITMPDGSDELTFTESGGITGSYVNGVLTLTGNASAAAYQAVLQSVSLSTDVAGVRTIEFAVTDAAGQESVLPGVTLLTVTPTLNGAPTIVTTPVGVGSTGQSTTVSPIIVIVNEPGELLSGATVTITMPDGSDELTFTESGGITGSYLNGVLTLTGDASAAAYQTVLQSVSLSTNVAGVRAIEFAVTDAAGQESVLPGVTLFTVTPALNGAPTIVTTPVGVGSTGQSTTVSPIIVIVNEPGELLSGATVTITEPDGSDELTFTGSGGITGSYVNGVLTLTGDASAAAYQAVLQSVSLSTDAAGVRTIQFAVTDAAGQDSVSPGVTLLTVTPTLNGAPTIVATPVGVGSTGQSNVVSPIILVVNEPSELLSGATVTITAPDGSDELTFTESGGITGSYSGGVLTLTGDASAAAYQAVLQSVSLSTDVAGVRTIQFAVTDAAGQVSALPGVTLFTVTPALNGAPTIVATPVGVGSTGQSNVVSPIIVIVNEPGELLSGATVTITVLDGSDELTFVGSGEITGSYSGGVLTLTGDASAAAYQAVLQSVSLSTDIAGVRTIEFSVTDAAGQESALPGVTLFTVTPALNGAPTIVTTPVAVGSTGQSTTVSPVIVIVNEPGELLSGATVTITVPDGSDELTFNESGGITGSYSGGMLTLTGDASAAAYQTVLQSVSLSTDAAGVRTIEFSVTDAAGQSSVLPGLTTLTVVAVLNAPPTVVATPVGVGTAGQPTTVSPIITIVNDPGEQLSGATVTITNAEGTDELTFTGSNGITGTYSNGVLALTGNASATAYQTVLQSVSFTGDVAGLRTIEFSVTDIGGQPSLLPGVTALTVVGVLNTAPTIVATPVGATAVGQSTTVSPIIVIVNDLGENLTGATVTITNAEGTDELTFTGSNGITGTYADGVLELTGNASAAAYQTVLQSVSFTADTAGVRSIEFQVIDAAGQEAVIAGVTLVTVVGLPSMSPTVVATPVATTTVGQSTTVSPVVTIVNDSGENLSGATVTITVGLDGSDELTFTGAGGITGSYSNGVLTLSGDASATAYQTVLQSVSFSTDIAGVRTISFQVTDVAGQQALLPGSTVVTVLAALNAPPTVLTLPAGVATTGQQTTVSPVVTIVNDPTENLSGATVTITAGLDGSDALTFTGSGGITGSYSNGALTLSGNATAAAYQTVLQSVSFTTGVAGLRTIEFQVIDAAGQQALLPGVTAVTAVAPVNAVPTVVALPVGVVTAGQSTTVSPIVTIVNDPTENLTGATVTITAGAGGSDVLTFTGSGGITGSYSNGVLTLSGNATAAAYQTVLQSVSFTTNTAGVRIIEFSVTDTAGQSPLLPGLTTLTVVAAINAAPTILATPVAAVTAGQTTTVSPVVTIVNDPGQNLSGATVTIGAGRDAVDVLTFTPSGGITGSFADGVLTLSGNASLAAYQTVLQSVQFTTGSGALIGVRTIEFAVTDVQGATTALPGVTALTVSAVNLPPTVLTSIVGNLVYNSGSPAITVDPLITVSDPTSSKLSSVTLAITVGHDTDDVLTYTKPAGSPINGSYNSATGVLTLTGDGTPAQYQEALRAVKFSTPQLLLASTRTFTVFATDNGGLSSLPLLIALVILL
ncbi:beta strand repeat-containing protein [Mycolicibacterium bacteremicum]|nr:hypothetical protein [Mycolicibacterium bacteremicum]